MEEDRKGASYNGGIVTVTGLLPVRYIPAGRPDLMARPIGTSEPAFELVGCWRG